MLLAALAALSLQAASAPPSAAAAGDAPTTTAPGAVDAGAAASSDTPSGAPTDDFGFVNWCKGALSGHMELYPQVKLELAKLEAEKAAKQDSKLSPAEARAARAKRATEAADMAKGDREQMAAGRDYLALYDRGIAEAEKSGAPSLHAQGEDAQGQGYRIWSAARAADDRTKMWSWLMWELPARCETSAKKLETQSALLGAAFQQSAPAAAAPEAVAPTPPASADAPAGPPADSPADSGALRGPQ